LRMAQVVSTKLGLPDIVRWLDWELNGYSGDYIPHYRYVAGAQLQIFNHASVWTTIEFVASRAAVKNAVHAFDELRTDDMLVLIFLRDAAHDADYNKFQQRFIVTGDMVKPILQSIKNELLNWTLELDKRQIRGECMQFDAKEKKAATLQIFNVQNNIKQFTGVLGDVHNSQIALFDYGAVHPKLKELRVPQEQRNELENIMDEMKTVPPEKKGSVMERAKSWVVKNEKFLGASIGLIRKALGLE
jgi:hypothetical protein